MPLFYCLLSFINYLSMKENKTKAVVCQHCGQSREVAAKREYLFNEEWLIAEPREFESPLNKGLIITVNPHNLTEEEWRACQPCISRDAFIHQLHERVKVLESILIEKGGAQ